MVDASQNKFCPCPFSKRIYSLNLNYSDFVVLNCSISNESCTFLVDSQADISVIKYNVLKNDIAYDSFDTVCIRGVTDGGIHSLGTLNNDLYFENASLTHKFHIVPGEFNIPADGILGRDFIKLHQCHLDYEHMIVYFNLNNERVVIPMLQGPDQDTIVLPARCEVIPMV